ncbi:hypothetical protein V3G71_07195 [Microbacterium paraoxydans]|uniref:hypothetical protein n=1 Tax=Microbacterium paraoxydans TaxID=199592 RepID=UPI002F265EF9
MKKTLMGAIGTVIAAMLLSGSGVAYATTSEPSADADATATLELPAEMTDAELQSLLDANDNTLNFTSTTGVSARAGGDYCLIFPGNMWNRKSGNIYKYGTVGSKPRLGNCTGGVVKTKLESYVYKRTAAGWTKVTKPFVSYGTGNMEQKSVQYVCKGKGTNTFQVISVGTGTNSRGQSAVGTDSTGPYSLTCQ